MEPLAYVSAAVCALSMTVAAWGVTQVWTTIILTVGRNPQVKKDVDIYNPEIRIYSDVDLTGFNYAQIEYFGRYYFIEHIEPYPNGIYTFFLKCDVLESFKGDILTSQQMVNNQEISVLTDIVESDVNVASLDDTSFILTTIGVDF